MTIDVFPIQGEGVIGYIRSVPILRRKIKRNDFDVVHAHYSFCGIISSFATKRAVVVSLMGSDVKSSGLWRMIIRFFCQIHLEGYHSEI